MEGGRAARTEGKVMFDETIAVTHLRTVRRAIENRRTRLANSGIEDDYVRQTIYLLDRVSASAGNGTITVSLAYTTPAIRRDQYQAARDVLTAALDSIDGDVGQRDDLTYILTYA